ncbi:MAG: cation-translocating P-type ATPase, partial [Candidatus Bathyarchaeia archaeon]
MTLSPSHEWHAMDVDEVIRLLETGREGLSEEEAERRLRMFGPNELVEKGRVTAIQLLLRQFKDVFVAMLIVAISISIVLGWYETQTHPGAGGIVETYSDAITISAIVVLNAVVGFLQEYRSERAMEAMKKMTAPKARLIRGGRRVTVPAREVVPGDLILLETGDRIPADAILLKAIDVEADEAVLTGESTPVPKRVGVVGSGAPVAERSNMVFTATHVVYGRGEALVTATGMATEFGKIAAIVQAAEDEETPLQRRLDDFAKKLALIIVSVCVAVFLVTGIRGGPLTEAFMTSIALAVSAVPEGLPAIVTVTLALGARELAGRNAVIRRLSSVETLGSTTIICSDKTGTLTKGEMTVRRIYLDGNMVEVTGVGYEPKGEFY